MTTAVEAPVEVGSLHAGSVCLAYLHDVEVAHSWHQSVMAMLTWDVAHDQRLVRGGYLAMRCGSGHLVQARNKAAAEFLAGDAEWMFWLDTDMGFAPDTLDQLLASADPEERPVVGALCFAQQEHAQDGLGGFLTRPVPTLYRWMEDQDGHSGFNSWADYPADELVEVAGTGSACILIHRQALLAVKARYGPAWYSQMSNPSTGQILSEDLSFCAKLRVCDIPVHVDTRVKTSHLKPVWLGEVDYRG